MKVGEFTLSPVSPFMKGETIGLQNKRDLQGLSIFFETQTNRPSLLAGKDKRMGINIIRVFLRTKKEGRLASLFEGNTELNK
ncbi:hypothetical protein SLH46_05450 [Draconibacterium sp. IB214405]|uniref:hypothetical protein n=1 Tax=Draconibacterium sp. IB214405 TaxID=3097352 RepID=UPI002A1692A1|nr:hypothetical protein [Draconibacterium sp. IB214405]MDX8338616.1 hypothetical protein [Draconibacterium sp. IB214405]